jgi:hypothetical protein
LKTHKTSPVKRNKTDKTAGHQKTKESKTQTPTPVDTREHNASALAHFIGTTSSLRKAAQGAQKK